MALLIRPLIERANVLGEQLTGANKAVHGLVTDFLGGLKLAKGFNAEAPHIQHFTDAIVDKRERNLAFTRTSSLAHRPALLRAADYIVLLESGRVAATGTWGEVAPELFPAPDAN